MSTLAVIGAGVMGETLLAAVRNAFDRQSGFISLPL